MIGHVFALVLGTLVSEDLTTITAGLLVQRGELPFLVAVTACAMGIWVGDLALWALGRGVGSRALGWGRVGAADHGRVPGAAGAQRFREWFDRHALGAIIGSRLAPGTRLPLYVAAGACGTSFPRFALWSSLAVLLWTPALLALGAFAGERVSALSGARAGAGRVAVIAVVLTVVAWRSALWLTGPRHRLDRLVAAVSRLWRWEFWPMWLFYAPVAAWSAWLAVRYGGFRTITASNPGMADGGVVGESKFEILSRLPPEWTIPAFLIEPGTEADRLERLRAGVAQMGWTFPLVLKPDVGQRGAGVRLVHTWQDVADYVAEISGAIVVQPCHPGPFEAGVFYVRMPQRARGRILSITDKHFPAVTGDGQSSIEDLIWAHPRYRMQASTFLVRLGERRAEVPPAGERAPIGFAGNHAQGAMFTDGAHLITPALEARIDAIAQQYGGFYIGRFDIRYSDREAFVAGRDLAIVELNGATAECTNIYDPANSLLAAYKQLFLQWRLVFAIGAANRQAGFPLTSRQRLFGLVRAHLAS